MNDRVTIHGLTLPTRIGCTAEERATPQPLVFHIEMALSAAATRARGDLSGTVCWQQVKEQINELIGTGAAAREWVLVEDLCQDVTHLIFELSPAVVQVSLEIQKQSPQPPAADFVSVKTVRSR